MEWYPALVSPTEKDADGKYIPKKLGVQGGEGSERGLRLIGLYDGEKQFFFEGRSTEQMMDAFFDEVLTQKNSEKWIFAHYGGMADMQFILRRIVEKGGDYEVSASFSGSSAIIVKITRNSNTWTFIDSFWLLRDKLENLGKAVGIAKLTGSHVCSNFPGCGHFDPLDEIRRKRGNGRCWAYSSHEWKKSFDVEACVLCGEEKPKSMCIYFAPMPVLKTYNAQDCLILYQAIKQFEQVLLGLGGELQMTIASCAMRLFRRVYLEEDIINKGPGCDDINAIARGAYTSSRVEVFQRHCPSPAYMATLPKRGLNQCHNRCFDRWKATRFWHAEDFPFEKGVVYEGFEDGPILCPLCMQFAMASKANYYDLNSSFPYAGTFPLPGNVKKRMEGRMPKKHDAIFLAECDITVPPQYLPPIPYRHKGRVFFPHGSWRAWFSSIDLELLEAKGGTINRVYQSIEFHPQTSLRNYMIDVYEKRKNATSDYEKLILKFLLNAAYGKFSERPEKKSMLLYPKSTDCPHDPPHRCEKFPYCEHAMNGNDCGACMEMLWPGCYIVTNEGEVAHEWVPIGVHLTAIARKNLYQYLDKAQGDIYYADSISADRTVVLRSPDRRVQIVPVERAWEMVQRPAKDSHGKEVKDVQYQGWQALAMDVRGRQGWFPLNAIIRHKVSKTMWRVGNKDGQCEVTADHSIMMSSADEASPEDFVAAGANFVKLRAEAPFRTVERLDLWEFLKGLSWTSEIQRKNNTSFELVHHFSLSDDGEQIQWIGFGGASETTFRRFYDRNSSEMFAFLRLLGAYISEGSASMNGITTSRAMFTISNKIKTWLEDLMPDFALVTTLEPKLMDVGNGMWAIRSGSTAPAYFFATLGGFRSDGKKLLPFLFDLTRAEFAVFWQTMVEGDGNVVAATGQARYSSKSQELIAGLSYLLDQHGVEHALHARLDKQHWTLTTRPTGTGRNRKVTHVVKREPSEAEFVYDLSVEGAHTFVDGMGRVLLHNTDSVITTATLPTGRELGALKLEGTWWDGEFVAPKLYSGKIADPEPGKDEQRGKDVVKAKGFSRMTFGKFKDVIKKEAIKISRMTRILELYRKAGRALPEAFNLATEPEEAIVEKKFVGLQMEKRFMLPDGQTRPWSVEEILTNKPDPNVVIAPAR